MHNLEPILIEAPLTPPECLQTTDQKPLQTKQNETAPSTSSKPEATKQKPMHNLKPILTEAPLQPTEYLLTTNQTPLQTKQNEMTPLTSSQPTIRQCMQATPDKTVLLAAQARHVRGKKKIDCHPNDIGLIFENINSMTESEKLQFIEHVWKPPVDYKYPQHVDCGRKWRFSNDYMTPGSQKYYSWLVYSAHLDGVFCIACALFGKTVTSINSKIQKLYTEPLMRWNGMNQRFIKHKDKCDLHAACMGIMQALQSQKKGETQKISTIIDKSKAERIEKNRSKILPIIKTVVLCARQNIPMRGHRDDSKHLEDASNNPGNFQELLKFRVESGDSALKEHLENCPKNASYRSKTIQNEILSCIGNLITRSLAEEIRKARFFSVIADEATDSSTTEQMSLVIRFIDENSQVREEFIRFIECESTCAEALVTNITEAVASLFLEMKNLRGQAYDGAGNMAGAKSGVSTRIRELYPKALYFHCASHRLNLAVASSTNIRGVRNMMDSVRKCSEVFHFSAKKMDLLRVNVNELMPEDLRQTLLDVCKTRWLQRIDGLERVEELMSAILATLDMIASNHDGSYSNKDGRADARGLYWTFRSFCFIVHLVIVRNVMSYTLPLTYELQKKQLDIVKVYEAIDNVLTSLEECRANVNEVHEEWFATAVEFAAKHGTEPSIKRIAGQQTLRANYDTNSPSEYYKFALTIPLLDQVSSEMRIRFSPEHRIHLNGRYILPNVVISNKEWKDKIRQFADEYKTDLGSRRVNLETELRQWEIYWKKRSQEGILPDTIVETLTDINSIKNWYPSIYNILCLVAVVPATSNSCERSMSKLRTLKTYLRSTMSQERLSSLALANIHREFDLDAEKILDIFSQEYHHRLELCDFDLLNF